MKPQAPPSTRWDNSWSNLDVLEESLTLTDSPGVTRKASQLQKAEAWALQRSCPKLSTSTSPPRTTDSQKSMTTTAGRQGQSFGMSSLQSISALFDSADAVEASKKKRSSKMRHFLSRWSSKSLRSFTEEEKNSKTGKQQRNFRFSDPARDSITSRDLSDFTAESESFSTLDSNSPLGRSSSSSWVRKARTSWGSFKKSKDKGHPRSPLQSRSILVPQVGRS